MPVISRFYGIVITMRHSESEHNPPHIHAKYGEYKAVFSIKDGILLIGNMPPKAKQLINEFILSYKDDLLNMWNTQSFKTLPPLE